MKLMTKNGAYMNVYNPAEQERAAKRGWRIVPEKKEEKPKAKKKAKK